MPQRKTGLSRDLYRNNYRPGQRVTAAFAGRLAKLNLVRSSKKILRKGRDAKDVCLWIGDRPSWYLQWYWAELYTLWHGNPPIVPLPLANLSMRVVGAARSGKTTSAINPAMVSAIEQGIPICLYEYKADELGKGGQMDFLVPLALKHGYRIHVFAPGRDYSCIFNPIDLLKDYNDAATARTLAKTLIENVQGSGTNSDGFFGPAGERLVEGLIRLAKFSKYPDLAMAFTFLKLPDFAKRLVKAIEAGTIPPLLAVPFTQTGQLADVERTVGGIIAGALNSLSDFIQYDLLLSMMGTTNCPIRLGHKEMVVVQSDIFREKAVNPLLASIVVMMTNLNCSKHRKDPFVLCLDENSTLIMEQQANWPNLHRSKKLVIVSGYQNNSQMSESLGAEKFQYFESGMQIGFFFRPSHGETAEQISRLLGDREVVIQNVSNSKNFGNNGGGSRSINQQVSREPLIGADRINNFANGECILVHPECGTDRDGLGMPWYFPRVPLSKKYFAAESECQTLWDEKIRARMVREQKNYKDAEQKQKIRDRLSNHEQSAEEVEKSLDVLVLTEVESWLDTLKIEQLTQLITDIERWLLDLNEMQLVRVSLDAKQWLANLNEEGKKEFSRMKERLFGKFTVLERLSLLLKGDRLTQGENFLVTCKVFLDRAASNKWIQEQLEARLAEAERLLPLGDPATTDSSTKKVRGFFEALDGKKPT